MATIEEMMKKREKDFQNIELEVVLKNIMTTDEKGKITLVFYSPEVKSEYRKSYVIDDVKGRVDFNRAMFALGCSRKNYSKWLDRVMKLEVMFKISISDRGFIRYIKVLDKDKKRHVTKSLFLDSIEGLGEDDRDFLMTLDLDLLRKEFGH